MKIKIKSAKIQSRWYANRIGEVFEVSSEMTDCYLVTVPDGIVGAKYGVLKECCEIVKESAPKATTTGGQRKLF